MVRCLEMQGGPVVFGYPGAAIMPFYDAISKSALRFALTCTEQGAGHAASGYARMSGGTGVCIATSGPGAMNLMPAIATAYSDSIPMVAITGQVATYQLGRDVFQEVDTTGAAQPFTKYGYLIKSADDIARVFKEAFHIASTGRKGPVLIDVPVDVQQQIVEFKYPGDVNIRGYKPSSAGHALQVRKVAEAITAAKRPLLCLGGGVFLSGAVDAVREFCGKTSIPAVSTMMGIGALLPGHPLYYGMLGQYGGKTANTAVSESDLLVLIGARVGDRAIAKPARLESDTTVIHIDIDPAEIGKNVGATIPLVGDIAKVVPQLIERDIHGDWDGWAARLARLREEERRMPERTAKEGFVEPNSFVKNLCGRLPQGSVYIADVGQNQIWSAKNFCADGRFITTGGMGTMGYSIPAAIGAKLARPDKLAIAVCGDGAFQMSMNELATMRRQGAVIKIVVMQNGVLGMIKEMQKGMYGGRDFAVDLSGSPDLKLIAAAYDMEYLYADSGESANKAIEAMIKSEKSVLLACAVDPEEATA